MEAQKTALTELLNIDFPMMMAPMYFVSNEKMIVEAMNCGIAAAMPVQNWNSEQEIITSFKAIKAKTTKGAFGVHFFNNQNLEHLEICLELKIDYIICNIEILEEIIAKTKATKTKVFCEVLDLDDAKTAQNLNADAIIAINKNAMGKKGELSATKFLSLLKEPIHIPIIIQGGIGEGRGFYDGIEKLGADGCSLGSIFLATTESDISEEYKNACIYATDKEIVETSKILGFPTNVLKTNFIRRSSKNISLGLKMLSKAEKIKPKVVHYILKNGFNKIKLAATENTSEKIWFAGTAIRHSTKIRSVSSIINSISDAYVFLKKEKKVMSRSISRES